MFASFSNLFTRDARKFLFLFLNKVKIKVRHREESEAFQLG